MHNQQLQYKRNMTKQKRNRTKKDPAIIQKSRTIRLDDARWALFQKLGKCKWLRAKIDSEPFIK